MANCIYIMGKSATGKDTIYQKLKEKMDTNSYIPYTTRPKRDGEQDGINYNFINREQFEKLKKEQKVMEARHYNVFNEQGQKDIWTYATIDDNQWKKEGDFLTVGTLESYTSMVKYLKDHPEKKLNLIPVYIKISEQERKNRAINREKEQLKPNYEEMERRLKADNIDFSDEKLQKAGITERETFANYNLAICVNNILEYIEERINYKIVKLNPMMPTRYNREQRAEIRKKEREILEKNSNIKRQKEVEDEER